MSILKEKKNLEPVPGTDRNNVFETWEESPAETHNINMDRWHRGLEDPISKNENAPHYDGQKKGK